VNLEEVKGQKGLFVFWPGRRRNFVSFSIKLAIIILWTMRAIFPLC